jgi:hypothetical protein
VAGSGVIKQSKGDAAIQRGAITRLRKTGDEKIFQRSRKDVIKIINDSEINK